jgi:hypothetical protein
MSEKYTKDDNIRKSSSRLSRSTKLRKYESVYKSYVRKTEQSKISKSPRINRESETKTKGESKEKKVYSVEKVKKKSLNAYQKFVQTESKKDKYKVYPAKERMNYIAKEWKKITKI